MDEQKIINELNNFKNSKADEIWKDSCRSILLSQIFASPAKADSQGFSWPLVIIKEWPLSMVRSISQPLAMTVLFLFFIASTGVASFIAARGSMPGDSLYMAKIVGEKAQFVFTFNENEKAKLGMQFASNRAEEIAQVMAQPDETQKTQTVQNLVSNFKKEISDVRSRLEKINPQTNALVAKNTAANKSVGENKPASEETKTEAEARFFRADLGKDDQGIDIAEPNGKDQPAGNAVPPATATATASATAAGDSKINASTTPEELDAANDLMAILQEAKELMDKKDYSATLNKLNEADEAISVQVGDGQVKGVSESATSTDNIKNDDSASSTTK